VDDVELATLVNASRAGDADAYAEIVRRFERMARATGCALLGDVHRAEDAAQDAFIEAFYALPQLRDAAAFPGWFRRIVFKQCERQMRGARREQPLDDALAYVDGAPDVLETLHLHERVQTAMSGLNERQRLVTQLFYLAGYSQRDIVESLAWPLPTVKKQLFQARKRLIAQLREETEIMSDHKMDSNSTLPARVRFFLALRERDVATVKQLAGAQPNLLAAHIEWAESEHNHYWPVGYRALHYACAVGNLPMVQALIDAGADINALTKHNFATPLHVAVMQHRHDVIDRLIKAGANLGAANENGQTALHFAGYRGDVDALRLLLDAGAADSIKDAGGRIAADWAAHRGHSAALKTLGGKPEHIAAPQPQFSATSAILESGIKLIDLFAPLARGGVNAVFTPLPGVGKVVVLLQLIDSNARLHGGHSQFLGIAGARYTGPDFELELRDVGLESACSLHFARSYEPASLTEAVESAAKALDPRKESLLLVDAAFAEASGLQQRIERLAGGRVTVVWYGDHSAGAEPEAFGNLTGVVGFETWRARNGFWPSIDPMRSHSNLVSGRHAELVARARRVLRRFEDVRDLEGQEGDVERGRKLHAYLSQPFPVAELWISAFGELVPLERALAGLEAALET
jgi:RNA polymerase sigma factor (sigma-70 family)